VVIGEAPVGPFNFFGQSGPQNIRGGVEALGQVAYVHKAGGTAAQIGDFTLQNIAGYDLELYHGMLLSDFSPIKLKKTPNPDPVKGAGGWGGFRRIFP
jgi:hypothetical protein